MCVRVCMCVWSAWIDAPPPSPCSFPVVANLRGSWCCHFLLFLGGWGDAVDIPGAINEMVGARERNALQASLECALQHVVCFAVAMPPSSCCFSADLSDCWQRPICPSPSNGQNMSAAHVLSGTRSHGRSRGPALASETQDQPMEATLHTVATTALSAARCLLSGFCGDGNSAVDRVPGKNTL